MKEIFLYLLDLAERSPPLKPLIAISRHVKRWFEYKVTRRPILLVPFILVAALIILYSCTEDLTPKHECKILEVNNEEMYSKNGDDISFGQVRDCAKKFKGVAVEFFNLSDAAVPTLPKRVPNLVSGGLLISEPARGRGSDDVNNPKWHEYMLFQSSNNFTWTAEASDQFAFLADTCKETSGDNVSPQDLTIRSGILLKGDQPRPANYPDPKSIAACRGASQNNNFKKDQGCVMWNLELFVPFLEPKDLCGRRSHIDDWLHPGTKQIDFVSSESLGSLQQEARDRWKPKAAKSIPTDTWRKQISGAPKICIRWVDSDYKMVGDQSNWDEFGSVARIWCDY